MENKFLDTLSANIDVYKRQIVNHDVYKHIRDINCIRLFMESHVFAVWDFMSLLKALQRNLTCVTVPWMVTGDANTRYLINEIVTGEESDIDMHGKRASHFELYLDAMQQSNADTTPVLQFLDILKTTGDLETAFSRSNAPAGARDFVRNTFATINTNKPHIQAAVFTFGREDLIPDMFLSIVNDISNDYNTHGISVFRYYLERHIEVDGGHHSHLAVEMTSSLCGNDPQKWQEAEEAVIKSLQSRIQLWNDVAEQIKQLQPASFNSINQ
ncbi:DUF3050 domain-containing protein [Chitinophaga flava]|uniref:Heme oxygenase n=1 Tax=Chitinophaga flava TaxID=2259036 RepID=A0A365XUM5_9BACT|nr:DUF3050 domain-containing protein [Chitinophaga flava]RBL90049.1 heme oxygenase [Chitinophaga flava]